MERLHFEQVVEGLWLRALAGRITPALEDELRQQGLDLSKPLAPAYPAEKMHDWVMLTAKRLYPQSTEDDALRRLGADFFQGFARTFIGSALCTVMKVIGTRRSLERMERNFRTGNNYVDTRFRSIGPGQIELWLKDVNGLPAYWAGMIEEGGRATGAVDMASRWELDPGGGCTYRVRWTE